MLTIDHVSLQLPPGFETRAAGLVERIGAQLAAFDWPGDASVDHLRVDHALTTADASDETIAADIAAAVARQVRGGP